MLDRISTSKSERETMGYWDSKDNEGNEVTWGDGVADLMGDAIDAIIAEFTEDVGRAPTRAELRNGLDFTIGAMEELEEK